ncbi:bile acid-transporting ATPase [Neohortaea acidophila]|uniref:Bile acid-transporting ATPase n=1 Tax=Neohortaea acidophila TaxID=245834 RepID=A0A6A6PX17_9PEZI|nr:bile acid-transporting ATPase [Neohortaea acidophila]KAF2484582.1 bile acid-transporting ATPase [Neohortaea acidophila]
MFGQCKGNVWIGDDFSACFGRDYLQTLFPLIACAISALYLFYQVWSAASQSRDTSSYLPVKQLLVSANGRASHDVDSDDEEDDTDEEIGDEISRRQSLGMQPARSHTNPSIVTVDKPRGEALITLVEEVAVVADLAVQIAALILQTWGRNGTIAGVACVVTWAYIAVLTSLRLLFSSTSKFSFPTLWYHTANLYGMQWIFGVLLFRSTIIHPRSNLATVMIAIHFALNSLLLAIALASRKGNAPIELEYEGDIEPSREPLASVFSLATFSWVDPIVWKGYKKTFELADVWNLIPRDKAANVLADYRQLKKTTALAYHLLKYFKRELIVQAVWAAGSGVLTFVPTLLIMVILQYLEDPVNTPRNAAWFYVILLFVSGVSNALASGQALWIGRRVCIRLRAIIIGEIFGKTLRRRAGASSDKILGGETTNPDKGKGKQGIIAKIFSLGRKKNADDSKKPDDQEAAATPIDESQVSSGTIINLMAVDSFKVADICAYLHFLWAETPVQFIISIVLLYQILGYSSIMGIVMMLLLLPVNMIVARRFATVQKRILAATDARIHSTNEVLTNIRIIKYFAWEQRFLKAVDEKRAVELKELRNRYIVWATAFMIWSGAPILITLFTFLVFTVVEKRDLIPSVAFTALSLFSLLRIPLDQLADMIAHVQESKVSVDRIEEYLNEPETEKYTQLKMAELDDEGETVLGFDDGIFSWGLEGSDDFKMIDLDLRFKVGQMNVIIGPTGSGKTSMLMALLGEMTLLNGKVYLPGGTSREDLKPEPGSGLTESVAYCAQQAWLLNGTIKENIVFASDWDARRYKDVIVACSLQRDLEILDNGDQTLVGEKGVTLSGGQKQRISLARALYCKARHVLMDDVLSAVDSHTAKWIFDKALLGPLMYDRTCILVTHNATLCLPHADFAVVLDNGRVAVQGTSAEVISSGKLAEDMAKFESRPASRAASARPSRVPSEEDVKKGESQEQPANGHLEPVETDLEIVPRPSTTLPPDALAKVVSKDIPGMNQVLDNDITREGKATGAVKLTVILKYLVYMGGPVYWFFAGIFFILVQVSQVATNVWIRQWANAYAYKETASVMASNHTSHATHVLGTFSGSYNCLRTGSCIWGIWSSPARQDGIHMATTKSEVDAGYYLTVYAILGVSYMIITFLREGLLFAGSLTASKRIHRQLMESVSHAKFRFFDTTPLGQIMNRFSKDIENIDQEIAPVAVGVVHCLVAIVTIVIVISAVVPSFLIAGVFITIIYILIGRFYINSSRDLKRLESVQRSPLYQQFGEALTGVTTIRAYGDDRRFIRENLNRVNVHNRPYLYLWSANRWLAFRVDLVGALVAFFAGAFVVIGAGTVDPGAAGLALTYAVTFTENVLWFVRLYASNEQNMNSVERIKEYLDVEQEAAQHVPENQPAANWPSQGAVEFIDYSTRYRSDFDLVLKKITFRILPGEKVGVVGRTGAGKSSLALALFRALEAEEGKILIDNVDVGLIGLQDLRENIVMVPQDPTLFTGTIRSNLDPFGLFTDEEIFMALQRVQLISGPTATPSRPSTPQPGKTSTTSTAASKRLLPVKSDAPDAPSPTEPNTPTLENKNIFRNLSSPVAESGTNLSQGQRQLLCLARAMLKNPKVLLMDEATASIDYATDAKIQETIRDIKNTTVTIAHRLQTIIDYDKVLVLDKGEVIEFGDPYDLIRTEAGSFRGMCETSGDLEVLVRDAKRAYDARRLVDDS